MKYFLDEEFIEGFQQLRTGEMIHCTELISIGLVAEDGREYYAICGDYNVSHASKWVLENVIHKLEKDIRLWKSTEEIKKDLIDFIGEDDDIKFYAYFADYDWVVFCSIFGTMMDLPDNFPMYCIDLKQSLDEIAFKRAEHPHYKLYDKHMSPLESIKALPGYPKQNNEHNALDDARWNKKLYDFLADY